jgi:hypothetical protein
MTAMRIASGIQSSSLGKWSKTACYEVLQASRIEAQCGTQKNATRADCASP